MIIMGASGTGKSTSVGTLNPEETIIFNVLGKTLPFKGSMKNYSKDKKNIAAINDLEVEDLDVYKDKKVTYEYYRLPN